MKQPTPQRAELSLVAQGGSFWIGHDDDVPRLALTGRFRGRGVWRALAAFAGVSLLVAGCGGGTPTKSTSNLTGAIQFAECMRSHGVPNYPDPTTFARGLGIRLMIDPNSPTFQRAKRACGHFFPVVGQPPPKPSAAQVAQWLAVSKCMRAHAIYDFPDPTTTPPSNGVHVVEFGDGVSFVIPTSIDMSSPLFTRAATTCGFPLPPP